MTIKKVLTSFFSLFIILFLSGCNENKEPQKSTTEKSPLKVQVHTLKKEPYPLWANFSGKTQAVDEVVVLVRVSGEIKERLFTPGESVKKGQILFRIDTREYQAEVDQKKAILEKDKASLSLAKANVERYTPLVEEQLAPREKLDELLATQKQLEATIEANKAAIEAAMLNLSYCDVRASINGQIGKEKVFVGNIVKPGDELAKIVNSEYLYVNFNPSAEEVSIIQKYKSQNYPNVKVFLRGSKNTEIMLEGKIEFIDNITNTSTGTVLMRAKVHNPKRVIFPGSFVRIEIEISDALKVLAVDPDQVYQNQQGEFIYVVDKNNTVQEKPISPIFSNHDIVILPKTFLGERVVVEKISSLSSSLKVLPVEVDNPIKILD